MSSICRRLFALCVVALFSVGCPPQQGARDAGQEARDAGAQDAGNADAGAEDAGEDAGAQGDGGMADAGGADAGQQGTMP